jgi:hypothetical protein
MNKVAIITELSKLGEAIKAQGKAHKRLDAQWQVLALSAVHAFAEHGNVFYVNAVYLSLGKGARHKAMTEYMLAFGGVQANTSDSKETMPFIKDPAKMADLKGAEETMWFDMASSPKPDEVLDYLALALKMVRRAPKEGQATEHAALRSKITEAIHAYADANGVEVGNLPTDPEEDDDAAPAAAEETQTTSSKAPAKVRIKKVIDPLAGVAA